MQNDHYTGYPWPRRRFIRSLLRAGSRLALNILTRFNVIGRENIPESGPLIVVSNHFSYLDPLALLSSTPWPLELIGGVNNPGAPAAVNWIPGVWGILPVYRGTGSHRSLRLAEQVLDQQGVLGIFPEGGTWAQVLRPARPGAAFLAARSGARLLPLGVDGTLEIFPSLNQRRRAQVTVRIGRVFGPFEVTGRGRERRRQLDEVGHEIMRHIAELIPPERRGHYSEDPAIREAALGTEIYPWQDRSEFDFEVGENLRNR
jgi:1-acyl-sn-glycerol-3-phosphate acyltransferase